jgi:hypothetical protein
MTDYTWTIATCEHELQQVASQLHTGVALPLMAITRSQHMALVASHLTHQQKASSHTQM